VFFFGQFDDIHAIGPGDETGLKNDRKVIEGALWLSPLPLPPPA